MNRPLVRLAPVAVAVLFLPACRGPRAAPAVEPVATTAPPAAAPAAVPSGPRWSAATPVGRIVAERPKAARVLEKAGIDYCCGGATPLGEAARASGADPEALLRELASVPAAPTTGADRSWADAPLPDLMEHVVSTHHAYLREELPRLSAIVAKVRDVHGAAHPELDRVAATWARLAEELPPHLALEEERLFPALRRLAAGDAAARDTVRRASAAMRADHDGAGAALHELRELTRGFAVPEDACALYRQMLSGFEELEADLHRHVHLENNVLAPRAEAL